MLCERCHAHDAVVNLTTVRDADVSSTHLCAACAKEHGLEIAPRSTRHDVFATIVPAVEARGDRAEIARLLARLDRYAREHPEVPLPPAAEAFRRRHGPPAA